MPAKRAAPNRTKRSVTLQKWGYPRVPCALGTGWPLNTPILTVRMCRSMIRKGKPQKKYKTYTPICVDTYTHLHKRRNKPMAKQKRDLADAMEADLSAEPVSTTKGPVKEAPQKKRPAWQRPSRKNTQLLGAHFDPAVGRQLEMLRAELQI